MPVHNVSFVAVVTPTPFPAGQTVGATIATLSDSAGGAVVDVTLDINLAAVFSGVVDGTYTISVRATDATGATLGVPYVTPAFTVSDPAVTVNLPTGGTVTVS
jgi:hypothetical protein